MLLAFLLSLTAFAAPFEDSIYQGRAVSPDGRSWKSTVSLSFETADGSWAACSGVFVESDLILTAAHCRMKNGGTVYVQLYKENGTEPVQLSLAGDDFRFEAHPRYRKRSASDAGTDDIGVLVLKNHTIPEGFSPALLQHAGIASASDAGRGVYAIGAGSNERGEMSDHLFFAQGTITSYLHGSVMRVQFPGRTGICGGDSGGPVFVKVGGELYLSALNTSIEANLAKHCGNVLYANAITAARYEWIQATAQKIRADAQLPQR